MKTQTISYPAVCACGFLVALAALLGRSSDAQAQFPAHASNTPGRKVSKPAVAPVPTNSAVRYRITDLGSFGSFESEAFGINNKGQIVGTSDLPNKQDSHPFLYENGKMTDLGLLPGCFGSKATGINNQGVIVSSGTSGGPDMFFIRSFVYKNRKMQELKLVARPVIWATIAAINDAGQYVGTYQSQGHIHACWYRGTFQDLGSLAGQKGWSEAFGINNQGQVVGFSNVSEGGSHAVLFTHGKMIDLGLLPHQSRSEAHGINNLGDIVGGAGEDVRDSHAFLYRHHKMIDVNSFLPADSGWVLTQANGINDRGQIVGSGIYQGKKRAFLLSPLGAHPSPDGLMCDLLAHPEKVDIVNPMPRFSWVVAGSGRDESQTAYWIRLAESGAALTKPETFWWDSGKVDSDSSTAVAYAGPALTAEHGYFWQVQTWNRQGHASDWSDPQYFHIGRLPQPLSAATNQDRFTTARYPVEKSEIAPVKVQELGPGHYFLDFGRDAFAALKLTISNWEEGHKIVVHIGEAQADGPAVNRKPGGSVRYQKAEMALRRDLPFPLGGRHTYIVPLTPNDARRMPADIGPVMPFRYVEIENSPGKLTEESARQIAVRYPYDENAAHFTSSDPTLNAVWDLCRYSIAATTYAGVYVDGDRERKPYEADAYIDQLGHYAIDREFTLARYSHEYLIQHPTWPTEWILHSVLMAWTDYLYTGDDRSLRTFYPDLKAKTLSALERPDGLISTVAPAVSQEVLSSIHGQPREPLRDIVDWPAGERDGYEMRPVNTVVNAFHYRALVLMSQIAEALKKPEEARQYREQAAKVRQTFNAVLFDPQTGLYVDGEGSKHSSLHANMFALAFDLVPAEHIAKVAAFVRSRGMACSVYGAQFLMEALYRSGQADYALSLLTAHTDRSWSHMLDVGSTITLEAWDTRFKPNQDWNHAWGAAPANVIPRLLMGVEPLEPGFRRIRIRPQPGGLKDAKLKLPTIRGSVHVQFAIAPQQVHLQIEIPANTSAQVWVPRQGIQATSVRVDGVIRTGRVESDSIVFENIGSGAHTFDLTGITPTR
ncbi:MAG: hypothetical protein JWL77_846 [Chthonomonadaceae bacterium]|nr:hypothetical protein [Chthonomonadaceae bacterium]